MPGPRIHDGAIGTLLAGEVRTGESVDDLVLRAADTVISSHGAYLRAGASAVATNSFLAHMREGRRRRQLYLAAIECAREAIEREQPTGLLVGTLGPVGDRSRDFWEPLELLLDSGVSTVACETVTTASEASAFIEAWREVARGAPVNAILTCSVPDSDQGAWVRGLDAPLEIVVGLNCCAGPAGLRALLEHLCDDRGTSFVAPSAGAPAGSFPELQWPWADADRWATDVATLVQGLPLSGIGGCCGTTPGHIESLGMQLGDTTNG